MILQYKNALVIGKFLPPHQGHHDLIQYARTQAERVTVLLGARPADPIPGVTRLGWLREACDLWQNVQVEYTEEDLPDAPVSDREVSRVWAIYLQQRFPGVDLIVSSELYGSFVAGYMGISHREYDLPRSRRPLRGREILADPRLYWDDILAPARDFFRTRICVYGPESTGKTTLARKLADYFECAWVPEMAREYLGKRHVEYKDIMPIAELHARTIMDTAKQAGPLLIVDTDLFTTEIYSRHYFNRVPLFPDWVKSANLYTHYLFLDIDVPWVADPQRDSKGFREEHRRLFLDALQSRGITYSWIRGDWKQRYETAIRVITQQLERSVAFRQKSSPVSDTGKT